MLSGLEKGAKPSPSLFSCKTLPENLIILSIYSINPSKI
jgi:hypothetical protein